MTRSLAWCFTLFCWDSSAQQTYIASEPADIPARFHFPVKEELLLRYRDQLNILKMREHAWSLFSGMTQRTQAGVPIWETWYSADEIFTPQSKPEFLRGFEPARQTLMALSELKPPESRPLAPLSAVRFNAAANKHIIDNHLNSKATLDGMLANPDATKAERAILPFPREAIAIKTAWWLVRKEGLTTIPVWEPPDPTKKARALINSPYTWTRCVAIDPIQHHSLRASPPLSCEGKMGTYPVVPISRFYSITLSKAMADSISKMSTVKNADIAEPGGHAVLVAMHVTTKEIPDWVWATFWWHDAPQIGPFSEDRPRGLKEPWRNYLMDTTLSMDTPLEADEQPKTCFNPWLEGQFINGTVANCMTCHRRAVYPLPKHISSTQVMRGSNSIQTSLLSNDSGSIENLTVCPNALQLDFLWSLTRVNPTLTGVSCSSIH